MAKRERKRIGPFVITRREDIDPNSIVCANCERRIAQANETQTAFVPSGDDLIERGAVAWPNFGWFCSVDCESAYAEEFGVCCYEREAKAPFKPCAEQARPWWRRLFGA